MVVLTVRDVTVHKEAESQREAARLERERLLVEVQSKNEELQSQAEELEAQTEELRSQAEELQRQTLTLEEERARLRTIIDSAPEAILVADERGEVTLANPAAERLFAAPGAGGLEYYGQVTRYRPDHTPYQPHERPCFRAAVHRETQHDTPIALLWPDGQWRDVLVNAAPIIDSRGRVRGAVGIYQDITERKRAEETNRYLAGLIERVSDAIISADTQFMIRSWNHGAEEMYGWRADEVLGRSFSELVRTNFLTMTRDQAIRELFGSGAWQGEQIQHRKDGGTINVLAATSVLKDERGNAAGVVTVNHNITERKRVEAEKEAALEALRETRDYLDNLLTYANAPIIVWDRDFKITRFNGAFERLTGLQAGDVLGRELDILFPEDRREEAMSNIRRAVAGERLETVEIPIQRVDGTARTVLWNSATLYAADGTTPVATIAQGQDITQRVRAEAALRAALAEKEVLMREIYHRVKNNLQALIYLMDMQADYISDESIRQMIQELQERARSMALVHEKLYQSHNLAQIDFGDYLHELVDNLSNVFETGGSIVWHVEAENALLSVDSAIPCGLVVTELLTNAVKYAFPDGQPRTERGEAECKIDVQFRADGERFTLVVADNGIGLPPGLDWTATPSLGLQLINVLARHQLGGQVEVDTQAGTAFKITFTERRKR
jgi:PAS domain S-box-containing protein